MTVSVELKPNAVAWIAQAYDHKTMISPFSYIRATGFTDEDRQDLIQRGIITEQGGVSGVYAPLFDVVASAESFATVDISSGPVVIRAAVLRKDTMSVSMTADSNLLRWSMPANVEAIAAVFEDYIGSSSLRNVDFSLEGESEMLGLFFLLCDKYRQQVLTANASGGFFAQAGIDLSSVVESAQVVSLKPHQLAPLLWQISAQPIKLSAERIVELMGTLEAQGLIEGRNEKWYLTSKAALFAGSFLLIENVINLKLGSIDNGELYTTYVTIIQSGVHDLVYLEQRPQGIRMTTLSSQAALQFLREVM